MDGVRDALETVAEAARRLVVHGGDRESGKCHAALAAESALAAAKADLCRALTPKCRDCGKVGLLDTCVCYSCEQKRASPPAGRSADAVRLQLKRIALRVEECNDHDALVVFLDDAIRAIAAAPDAGGKQGEGVPYGLAQARAHLAEKLRLAFNGYGVSLLDVMDALDAYLDARGAEGGR